MRIPALLAFGPVLAGMAAVVLAMPSAAQPSAVPDGATAYKRCAACHLATGMGVPGAFPPLQKDFRERAAQAEGRRYLVLAVVKGLSGPITVEGKAYRGVMPAQSGLDDATIAAILNHVGTSVAKVGPPFKPYAVAEIGAAKSWGAALDAAKVAALHGETGAR